MILNNQIKGILSSLLIVTLALLSTHKNIHQKNVLTKYSNDTNRQEERYDEPDKASQWLNNLRQTTDKIISPAKLNRQLKTEIEKFEHQNYFLKLAGDLNIPKFKFENLGSSNFGGRIRGFVIKSDDPNILLAGAIMGGIFKSTNGGEQWETKSDFLPTLAIGSMVSDPDNPNRVFAGTGEGFFNSGAARGAGIFVSEDFGESWNQLSSTDTPDFYYVNRMVRVPNSNIILAATRTGIFRSTDLGQNWTETSSFSTNGRGFVDIKIDPTDGNRLLADHFGISNNVFNLIISSPSNIVGNYLAIPATFGPVYPSIGIGENTLLLVDDGNNITNDGCEPIINDVTDKIALIQRGSCNFDLKVKNAQDAGAIAVIIYQNNTDEPFSMGGSSEGITIPSAMISLETGDLIASETTAITANVSETISEILNRFIMKSVDAGITWEKLNVNNGLPEDNVGRMEIAFGQDGVVYIAITNNEFYTLGLWRADSINSPFSKTASNTDFIVNSLIPDNEFGQGWYDLAVGVHPLDSDTVFIGGVDQYLTTNAGFSIEMNSYWFPQGTNQTKQYIHSDHHGYYFNPNNPDELFVVSDGGVYYSKNMGKQYLPKNIGLSISQSYGIAVSPNGMNISSGTQDNGSQIYFGDRNAWLRWRGADGGYSAWNQQDGNFVYGSTQNGGMFGSDNGGNSIQPMTLPDTDGVLFIQPFAIDPNDGNRLIVGTDNVYYAENAKALRNVLYTDITDVIDFSSVSALTFNQELSNQILVGMSGGGLYKIDDVGNANILTNITPTQEDGLGSFTGFITDIKVDSNDPTGNTLYVTRANYDVDRIIKTSDGGNTWQSISGNLPDMPLYQVSIDPIDSNRLLVGSELGLWATNFENNTYNWVRYNYGISYNRVVDLVWFEEDTLFVATHGRGVFKASRNSIDISLNKFVTTDSSNDDDGIIDIGETGLFMVNLKNNSGFDIHNLELQIDTNDPLTIENNSVSIDNIAANSNVIVPIEATLNATTCVGDQSLNDIVLKMELAYDDTSSHADVFVPSSANQNKIIGDFIANAEGENTQMTATLQLGSSPWVRTSDDANSGMKSWFTSNEENYADKSLISPWMVMNGGGNTLNFSLKYNIHFGSDGVVLEIREKGGLWTDIGQFSTVSYDEQISVNTTAPTRFSWTGIQNDWRNAVVDLAETYRGKTIQFRFRMVSGYLYATNGIWLDDIVMSNVIMKQETTCDETISTGGKIPFSGLWFDRGRDGHGFVIEPIGTTGLYFTIFYTYKDDGTPEWYTSLTTLENGVLNLNFDAETLQRVIYDFSIDPNIENAFSLDPSLADGRLSIDFNTQSVISSSACQDGITGRPESLVALAKWKINQQQGEWCIEPLITEQNKGYPDIGGAWFGGENDSGWGLSLANFKSQLVAVVYYYDATGQPRWSIGQQDNFIIGNNINVQMTEISGFGRSELPISTSATNAGNLNIKIQNVLNNLMIDGQTSLNLEYQGSEGGQWIRNEIPIAVLTKPH